MMLVVLLSLIFFNFVNADGCIDNYSLGSDGICRQVIYPSNRYDAAGTCAYDGARLAKMTNAFMNTQIQNISGASGSVWIGLKCASTSPTSCGFDDGTLITSGSYRNFAPGNPNAVGTCISMKISSGQWVSEDCSSTVLAAVCEYDPRIRGNAACQGVSPYQDSEKQQIVKIHNDFRSKVAKGQFTAKTDKKPSATNMQAMTWDCNLENSAQAFADHCTFSTSGVPLGPLSDYGQNLYSAYAQNLGAFKGTGIAAAKQWESELQKKGWPSNEMTTDLFNLGIAAGTQMAWWNSNKVGCGVAECPSNLAGFQTMRIVACQYQSQGNILNQMIYNEGTTCSDCDDGFSCDKATGLCVLQ